MLLPRCQAYKFPAYKVRLLRYSMHGRSSENVVNPFPEPDGCIQPLKALAEISPDPYLLPPDLELEWSSIDLMNDTQVTTSKPSSARH